MYYRKKPSIVEAWQLGSENKPAWACTDDVYEADGTYQVNTFMGTIQGSKGDYLVKGINGELRVCRQDIFEETYEEV